MIYSMYSYLSSVSDQRTHNETERAKKKPTYPIERRRNKKNIIIRRQEEQEDCFFMSVNSIEILIRHKIEFGKTISSQLAISCFLAHT